MCYKLYDRETRRSIDLLEVDDEGGNQLGNPSIDRTMRERERGGGVGKWSLHYCRRACTRRVSLPTGILFRQRLSKWVTPLPLSPRLEPPLEREAHEIAPRFLNPPPFD